MNGPHERRLHNRNVDVFTLDTDRNPYSTHHTREYVHRKQVTKAYYCEQDDCPNDYNLNDSRDHKFDTVDAVDRISDEFRFLDDRQTNCQKYIYVFVAATQVIVGIGMIIFAALRYRRLFLGAANTNTLLDLSKAEDFASNNREGAAIIAVKSGTSVVVPAFLQILAGLCGFWPLVERRPNFLQILLILFGSISIFLWIEAVLIMSVEINLEFVQIRHTTDAIYGLLIAVLTILAIDVIFINAILVAIASTELIVQKPTDRSKSLVIWNVLLSAVALATLIISAIALSSSMTGVSFWNQTTTNPTAMYNIGLREVVISGLVLFSSTYGLYSACLEPGHRFGAAIISSIALLSTVVYIFNTDRILSITHNIRILLSTTNAYPIGGILLLILYCLLLFLAFGLVVVTAVTFAVHFPATRPDCPVGPKPIPSRPPMATDRSHPRTPHFGGSRL
ncbi:hypothetical protein QR680_014145 [Steinernema hermaphroditum]|uniref:Uncharacterized protein n=1 Tax=Steinernema hermaphroditum TaxID=289476 RepID=A0AA39IAK4_9BILA|nr:hypothetical protein QR680_014145 [Steinernema hermaphroditum]